MLELGARVAALVAAGATVDGACALHAAAANHRDDVLALLFAHARGGAVNFVDASGQTPLMVAAVAAAGSGSNCSPPKTACVRTLLRHGADRGAVDPSGRTAYGQLRGAARGYADFSRMFGMGRTGAEYAELERLLLPPGGPTDADNEVDEEDDDEDDDDSALSGADDGDY